jgi:hypothetical protein
MKTMKSSLLDEERGNKAKVSLKMIHVNGRICWLLKTVLVVGFCCLGYVSQKSCNILLKFPPRLGDRRRFSKDRSP